MASGDIPATVQKLIKNQYTHLTGTSAEPSLVWSDEDIKKYTMNALYWIPNRQPDNENGWKKVVTKLELLMPKLLVMAGDEIMADFAITSVYQIARNFLVSARPGATEVEYVFTKEVKDNNWVQVAKEGDRDLKALWDVASDESQLNEKIKKIFPLASVKEISEWKSDELVPSRFKVAYIGLYASMFLRSIVKDDRSMGYLFNGSTPKVAKLFQAFYLVNPPYAPPEVSAPTIKRFCFQSKYVPESRTFLFVSAYSKVEAMEEIDRRLIKGAYMQTMMLAGIPSVSWPLRLAEASQLTVGRVLQSMLAVETMSELGNIAAFTDTYAAQKYAIICRILDPSYHSNLGRKSCAKTIVASYVTIYYLSNPSDRDRLRTWMPPSDPTQFGLHYLYGFMSQQSKPATVIPEIAGLSFLSTETKAPTIDVRQEAQRIYSEAMRQAREATDDMISQEPVPNPESQQKEDEDLAGM